MPQGCRGIHCDFGTHWLQMVRSFWNVAHSLSYDQQKLLLQFVTGSDRVPIKGLGALNPPFVISKMGGDVDTHLPSAHTCCE